MQRQGGDALALEERIPRQVLSRNTWRSVAPAAAYRESRKSDADVPVIIPPAPCGELFS
jgi:hypothetical protein